MYLQIHHPILIQFYPRKQGWPELPHPNSNLSNSHSPPHSIQGILLLQTNTLEQSTLLHHNVSSTSSLVVLTCSCSSPQPPLLFSKHAHHPSSTRLCHLNHFFLQSQHLHLVLCPLFLHQFCTTNCFHHNSLGPSQNCHFIFPETPCLTPIQHRRSYTTPINQKKKVLAHEKLNNLSPISIFFPEIELTSNIIFSQRKKNPSYAL